MKNLWKSKATKGTILSLLLAACTTFTACNNDKSSLPTAGNQLQLSFGINAPESRAIFTDTKLPDGSPVGVRLEGYADYANLVYTGTTTSGTQSWASTTDVTLTDTKGTLYAYWPQNNAVSIDAIPVDMTAADQTDWLYATPVTDVNEDKASVAVTMNHALANINITVNKGTYKGDGVISNITLQSDGIALGGTFNAAQTTPGYTAFEDEGKQLSRTVSTTAGGTATDIMVVPTGTPAPITFLLTIDDIQFKATSQSVWITKGNSYQYTLNLSDISTYLEISGFSVKQWTSTTVGTLDLEEVKGNSGPAIDATGKANGVYVVTAAGQLVDKTTVAADAIGVALITANQSILIEKNGEANTDIIKAAYDADGAPNTDYEYFFWGMYGSDVAGITNISSSDAAKQDFNGKANTAAIIATPDTDDKTTYANMGTYCTKFNEMSGTYADWYIPAVGQLYEIYTNVTDINTALTNIGGTTFNTTGNYWSSSENSSNSAWYVSFLTSNVNSNSKDYDVYRVRFVRDI